MTETPLTSGPQPAPDRVITPDVVAREDPFPWWLLALLGVTSIVFGIAVLIWPDVSLRVMAAFVGVWLVIAGMARVFSAFVSGRGVGAQVLSGIVGVLLILGGIACLRNLVTALALLATLVSLTWLLSGLSELAIAFTATGSSRGWLIALGVVSTLVGLTFAVWPELSLATLVLMTSLGALVVGAAQVAFAWQIRNLTRTN
jgi:uncharacterized membrane protein HdeD (DUF308 family)